MTIISKHVQAAPATAYALSVTRERAQESEPFEPETNAVLLALAALADEALYSDNGYSGHTFEDVAEVLGLTEDPESDVRTELIYLRELGHVNQRGDGRFRITQTAFDRANGDA